MNLISLMTLVDDTVARQLLAYHTTEEATSAMYSTMASAVANDKCKIAVCVLMDDTGVVCKTEKWFRQLTPNA